jgi:hypothetical protein
MPKIKASAKNITLLFKKKHPEIKRPRTIIPMISLPVDEKQKMSPRPHITANHTKRIIFSLLWDSLRYLPGKILPIPSLFKVVNESILR